MDHRIQHVHQSALLPKTNSITKKKPVGTSFQAVLSNFDTIKISKHAQTRLTERNIKIDDAKWQRISEKVVEARQKGITDSLVVTDQATLLVSTKNNTVVTAMDRQEAQSRIFTNINGTILVD